MLSSVAALAAAGTRNIAWAQDSGAGPDALNSTLTPLGGIRAGNADGTIPAWTGGYSTIAPGYVPGEPRPDPFADEKPVLSITPANLSQYQDKLPFGVGEMMQRHPDYRVDVYPTHRTAVAPQFVYDNTYKNATRAQLSPDGNAVTGAFGGTPFPIPKNGSEVAWNHLLAWKGQTIANNGLGYTVTTTGQLVENARVTGVYQFPYYMPEREASFDGFYFQYTTVIVAPPYQAGGAELFREPINSTSQAPRVWQYLAGQRRTREAPELQYDSPNFFVSGIGNWDEYEMLFGPLNEYNFKLLGKREMYVPYNMNRAWQTPIAGQLGPHFFNPDIARWELHRVWVVEMTVKQGFRNTDARRLIYVDEDTWNILLCDVYDASGAYWKFLFSVPVILPDIPCMLGGTVTVLYDLHAGVYSATNIIDSSIHPQYKPIPDVGQQYFTPGMLAATAGGE